MLVSLESKLVEMYLRKEAKQLHPMIDFANLSS